MTVVSITILIRTTVVLIRILICTTDMPHADNPNQHAGIILAKDFRERKNHTLSKALRDFKI